MESLAILDQVPAQEIEGAEANEGHSGREFLVGRQRQRSDVARRGSGCFKRKHKFFGANS